MGLRGINFYLINDSQLSLRRAKPSENEVRRVSVALLHCGALLLARHRSGAQLQRLLFHLPPDPARKSASQSALRDISCAIQPHLLRLPHHESHFHSSFHLHPQLPPCASQYSHCRHRHHGWFLGSVSDQCEIRVCCDRAVHLRHLLRLHEEHRHSSLCALVQPPPPRPLHFHHVLCPLLLRCPQPLRPRHLRGC